MRGQLSEYCRRETSLPCLRPGQVLVLGDLSVHHGGTVETMVSRAGCELFFLPADSPDPNPIESMFAKIEALLKNAAALPLSALGTATKEALDAVTLDEIQDFHTLLGVPRQRP